MEWESHEWCEEWDGHQMSGVKNGMDIKYEGVMSGVVHQI